MSKNRDPLDLWLTSTVVLWWSQNKRYAVQYNTPMPNEASGLKVLQEGDMQSDLQIHNAADLKQKPFSCSVDDNCTTQPADLCSTDLPWLDVVVLVPCQQAA